MGPERDGQDDHEPGQDNPPSPQESESPFQAPDIMTGYPLPSESDEAKHVEQVIREREDRDAGR